MPFAQLRRRCCCEGLHHLSSFWQNFHTQKDEPRTWKKWHQGGCEAVTQVLIHREGVWHPFRRWVGGDKAFPSITRGRRCRPRSKRFYDLNQQHSFVTRFQLNASYIDLPVDELGLVEWCTSWFVHIRRLLSSQNGQYDLAEGWAFFRRIFFLKC